MGALLPTAWLLGRLLLPVPLQADVHRYFGLDGWDHFSNLPAADGNWLHSLRGNRTTARGSGDRAMVDAERYTRYDPWVREASSLYHVPEALVRALIRVESDYDATAVSPAGARGLMQLMPETAALMQVDIDNPRDNILGGVRILHALAREFSARVSLMLAGYNAGAAAVIRFGGVPPFPETREYIVKVRRYYARYCTIQDLVKASQGWDE